MKLISTILLFTCIFVSRGYGQQNHSLSGYIRDAETGEDLIGATIYAPGQNLGTITNAYGFFSLSLPANQDINLTVSYIGYESKSFQEKLTADKNRVIRLAPYSHELDEIVITSEQSPQEQVNSSQMSMNRLTAKEIQRIPAIFGEVDIIKALQLKPGVQAGSEGMAGLYVRGGGPDQNLIVLDEAIVYNANHLFGFFSTFNPDAVKDVELYKGDFPARYGGRLSSVVDIKLKDGNKQEFAGSGGLGIIASRLTLEAPIIKDKSSFMISGRRTYLDIFTRAVNQNREGDSSASPVPNYYFYDLNTKVNFELGEKDRVFLSGYFGRDVLKYNDTDINFGFDWGNATTTLRWNHIFNPKLFANTSLIFSDYRYNINTKFDIFSLELGSTITDYTAKIDFDYLPANEHSIQFGGSYIYHDVNVGRIKASEEVGLANQNQQQYGTELGAYFSSDWEVNQQWLLNSGLRISGFEAQGKWYGGLEPRFSARYKLNENTSIKASAARMYQYIHLVSNSGASLPTDIWYPTNQVVNPQRSDQVAAGISTTLFDGKFLLSNELYHKWMKNQIDFKDGAEIYFNPNLDDEFVFGKGRSYGNEIYLEKKTGKTTGWIGYTLAWTWREFPDIDDGRRFFPRYDRRHDVSAVLMHELSKKIHLSANWVYGSGNAISMPVGRMILQDTDQEEARVIPVYEDRNNYRMAPYHRLDLGVTFKFNPKWGESDLTVSIYNVYNRRNPFFIYIEEMQNEENSIVGFEAKQVSLFPIIPSVTYNFRF